MKLYAAFD